MPATEITPQRRYSSFSINSYRSSNSSVNNTNTNNTSRSRKNSFGISSLFGSLNFSSSNSNSRNVSNKMISTATPRDFNNDDIDNINNNLGRSNDPKYPIPAVLEPSQVQYLASLNNINNGCNFSTSVSNSVSISPSSNPFGSYSNYTTSINSELPSMRREPFKLPEEYHLPIFLPLKSVAKDQTVTDFTLTRNNSDSKHADFSTFHFVNAHSETIASIYPPVAWNIAPDEQPPHEHPHCKNNIKTVDGLYSIRLTPFIDPSIDEQEQADFVRSQGLYFDPIIRTAGPESQLVIARYMNSFASMHNYNDLKLKEYFKPILFKSNVVSRLHGCVKVDRNGQWYIKDFNSSSGTFLNHKRICSSNDKDNDTLMDGGDHLLHDGDVIQLGMDYNGGRNQKFRCVKVKVELNLSWKIKSRNYKKMGLEKLHTLNTMNLLSNDANALESCSICLEELDPCQGIFISPCSHTWHFNCIRRLLLSNYPQFICPNCRATTDLEASMDNLEIQTTSPLVSSGKNTPVQGAGHPHSPLTDNVM
ncbi:similar to Saccharomyces cerevisiae YHR115C DMA1 Protein involved in ubiquitin ligation [Maudiozyma barnettii]|uniref:RING-type E3 ubiquitin transferase n=1 Tax=Maudiozyma barnettii TaxID=61262 RepID=A0A8H2VC02_9SACH|nr:uncharacterized protein KABA2_01S14960 [Kazachstania barnettii]CAB4252495.1 similar to Saccharomyces cerevisiae YHR115C DMA1 Protein involved in ubiquitin ligation [Kazachstania barnettii]CAD1779229.1 similar to Saccharomyces cerevisiae YHR115C DMA1 Protein involved in ubiquitin ligation [Kazachstania barnettii]